MKKGILQILLTTIWISASEFGRNQFLLMPMWVEHYKKMGLIFPAQPVNGLVWGIWSSAFAVFIFIISKKFSIVMTALLSWLAGFVFMWLVLGNMGVLPFGILIYAIPLSIAEVFVASWLAKFPDI